MSDTVDPLRALIAEIVRDEIAKALAAARPSNDEYLTAIAAGELAGVSAKAIRQWVRDGKLTEHRAGKRIRVRRAELEALLRAGGPTRKAGAMTPEALARRDFG